MASPRRVSVIATTTAGPAQVVPSTSLRRFSRNELDSSSSTERARPVILSASCHPERQRRISLPITTDPSLRGGVTFCDGSNGQGLFFTIEPCLRYASSSSDTSDKQF